MKLNYSEQLKTKEWKEKRDLIIVRDKFCCKNCNSTYNLQVHHKKYIFGRMAWEYPDSLLITLCRKCHIKVHKTTIIVSEKDNLIKNKPKKKSKPKKKKKINNRQKLYLKLSPEDLRIQKLYDERKAKLKITNK